MVRRSTDDRTLIVLMDGRRAGEIHQSRNQAVRLLYDESYSASPSVVPLSLSMPTALTRHGSRTLDPWLQNLLPDNPDVLSRWRTQFKVRDRSAFALLAHVGEDVAGAAQFVRPDQVDAVSSRSGHVDSLTASDIAGRLRVLRTDPAAWEPTFGNGRFSLAGSQSKFAAHMQADGSWGIPGGATPTTHILKPAIRGLADQDINEHLTMRGAHALGLAVPSSGLATFDGERAFVVERYDRIRADGGPVIRLHQEDMCQALGIRPERKYEEHGGPGVRDIASLIRATSTTENGEADVQRFADAVIFNWVVVGTDAHAKNYSMLLLPSATRLAPLYDLNSYLPYMAKGHRPVLSMLIGTSRDPNEVTRSDWRSCARDLGLDTDRVLARVEQMVDQAPDAFSSTANTPEIRELQSQLPRTLTDLVADRSKTLTSMLKQPINPAHRTGATASAPQRRATTTPGTNSGSYAPEVGDMPRGKLVGSGEPDGDGS